MLKTIRTPGGAAFTVDATVAPKFLGLLTDLEGAGYGIKGDQSGGYNPRNIAGTNTPSQHAFGRAIDVNWAANARGSQGDIPPELARQLATKYGLTWGGDWKNPDPMHFEIAGATSSHPPFSTGSQAMPIDPYTGATPESVAYARRMADQLIGQGMNSAPVGHWTQALARVLQSGVGGAWADQARRGEQQGQGAASQMLSQALAGNTPMNQVATQMMANPWTRESGQALAMRQLNRDPLEGQKSQAQIDLLKAQTAAANRRTTDTLDSPETRAAAAQKFGLDPNSDQGKAFILTGRLPREDQQALTATDKKAILEADQTVSQTTAAIQTLNRAMELSKKAYDGATANERGWLTSQWGNEAGIATRELNQAVTQTALQQLKAIFGGNPTEGERKILLDIQGSAELPQKARDSILAEAKRLAEIRLQFYQDQANQIRGGTYYKPQTGSPPAAPAGEPAVKPDPLGIR